MRGLCIESIPGKQIRSEYMFSNHLYLLETSVSDTNFINLIKINKEFSYLNFFMHL